MGRRKIEIQPILHDRNRSVTFLKRKNGLFKKAYELGVLCSVDVLVVVFGHNGKLYEYSSAGGSNPSKILDKRVHWGGEREGRGPQDFNGDKAGGGDDNDNEIDDLDDSDEGPSSSRRQPPSKSRQSTYATRGRTSTVNSVNTPEDEDEIRPERGLYPHDRGQQSSAQPVATGAASAPDPAVAAANFPYHFAQLLAAAAGAAGQFDANRHQGSNGLFGDNQQGSTSSSIAAAGSLGASLAQIFAANPYLALPNLLGIGGALGLNSGGNQGGLAFPGAGGAPGFGAPAPSGPQGVHPLYNSPLFASLLQSQSQPPQNSLPNLLNAMGANDAPRSNEAAGLKLDWPAPHGSTGSYRSNSNSNADPIIPSSSSRRESNAPRSPDGGDKSKSNSLLDFLNAISAGGANAGANGLGHASVPSQPNFGGAGGSAAFANPYGQQQSAGSSNAGLSNLLPNMGSNPLSFLGNLGLGGGLPGLPMGLSDGAGDRGSGENSRKRSREFDDDDTSRYPHPHSHSQSHSQTPLSFDALSSVPSSSSHQTSATRGYERFMGDDDLGGGGSGSGQSAMMSLDPHPSSSSTANASMNFMGGGDGGANHRGDALHLDIGRAPSVASSYDDDTRASKRGRPS
ncbi:hypothetical protein DL93DRAFT_2077843 [Clavulina sp. PMI_390]|nr:hypothetical protein DL93DRAFT_2077843 [Clavulina sp. PMI_390]